LINNWPARITDFNVETGADGDVTPLDMTGDIDISLVKVIAGKVSSIPVRISVVMQSSGIFLDWSSPVRRQFKASQ